MSFFDEVFFDPAFFNTASPPLVSDPRRMFVSMPGRRGRVFVHGLYSRRARTFSVGVHNVRVYAPAGRGYV